MEGVVLRGTARSTVKVPGYSVAGKTGTAQIFDVKTHHYTHTYNGSFMGFSPIQNPAVVVIVTLNGTSGNAGFGGAAAGPVFNVVAGEALRILDIPKDIPETDNKQDLKLVKKADPEEADDVAIAGLDDGQPNIMEDDTDAPEAAKPVLAAVTPAGPRVPNFHGKTEREVMALASQAGIPVVLAGSGVVRGQMPLAGEVLLPGQKVKVQFAR
jgi:cell division protein FtsI (penicillin-binding protein 3)